MKRLTSLHAPAEEEERATDMAAHHPEMTRTMIVSADVLHHVAEMMTMKAFHPAAKAQETA